MRNARSSRKKGTREPFYALLYVRLTWIVVSHYSHLNERLTLQEFTTCKGIRDIFG